MSDTKYKSATANLVIYSHIERMRYFASRVNHQAYAQGERRNICNLRKWMLDSTWSFENIRKPFHLLPDTSHVLIIARG